MQQEISNIKAQAIRQIMEADDAKELERIRIEYLGRNGKLAKLTKRIGDLKEAEKRQAGLMINQTKKTLTKELAEKKISLKETVREWFDPTLPGKKPVQGHLHLVTQAITEISDIFEKIGFVRIRYPEVDWDWYAFESLNMPKDHPARDIWETFFVDAPENKRLGKMVLTPHTSNGQVREMERTKPPIRMVNIAKCHRRQSDATHYPMFHQFEGLVIDQGINITHLKGTLDHFAQEFYGPQTKSRIRPYNFKFTEPSFEVDFSCVHCDTQGCKFCKSGWHEVGGAGMVHPNVLKAGGIDTKKYTGFAFGWGVERTMLLRPGIGINDIRILYESNLNILRQY